MASHGKSEQTRKKCPGHVLATQRPLDGGRISHHVAVGVGGAERWRSDRPSPFVDAYAISLQLLADSLPAMPHITLLCALARLRGLAEVALPQVWVQNYVGSQLSTMEAANRVTTPSTPLVNGSVTATGGD